MNTDSRKESPPAETNFGENSIILNIFIFVLFFFPILFLAAEFVSQRVDCISLEAISDSFFHLFYSVAGIGGNILQAL